MRMPSVRVRALWIVCGRGVPSPRNSSRQSDVRAAEVMAPFACPTTVSLCRKGLKRVCASLVYCQALFRITKTTRHVNMSTSHASQITLLLMHKQPTHKSMQDAQLMRLRPASLTSPRLIPAATVGAAHFSSAATSIIMPRVACAVGCWMLGISKVW